MMDVLQIFWFCKQGLFVYREEDMEGFKREQNIETLKIVVWHVLEYDHFQVEEHSYGQFHEGDTYVIRWQYMIVNAGWLTSVT